MSRSTLAGWLRIAAAGLIVAVVAFLVAATAITPITPAIARDFPDPAVLVSDDGYFAYSTASMYDHRLWHVPVQRADDPTGDWTVVGDAMPDDPGWALHSAGGTVDITAPEVTTTGRGYLLYYVARSAAANAQCVGTALAPVPTGPFRPTPAPLVCQTDYVDSIDPQSFTDLDGHRYLLYASGQTRTTIWLQPVSPDGLALAGPRHALISADRPDEHNIVEAPALVRRGSEYVLFYSGDTFNSGAYFTNYAIAPALSGPYAKHDGQFLNRDVLGGRWPDPGGQTVVPGDPDYLVFHASTGPHVRAMFAAGLTWGPDGRPTLDLAHGITHQYAALAVAPTGAPLWW